MDRQPSWRAVVGVAAAGLVVGCLLLGLQFIRLGWEPTAPFVVGTSWGLDEKLAARQVRVQLTPGNGYDGQWFLGLAYDPLLGQRLAGSFDMPRYRAGGPLQAVAGWLLAGGRAGAILFGLLAVGPLAVALRSAATGRLLAALGRSPWWGLGFAAVPGVVVGVTFATAEPLALALAALGLSLLLDGRPVAAGAAHPGGGGGRPGLVGLGLWWAYVASRIPAGAGDSEAVGAVGPPLAGWARVLGLVGGGYVPDASVGPLGAMLLLGSLALCVAAILLGLHRPTLLGRTGLLLGLYGLLLSGELLGRFLPACGCWLLRCWPPASPSQRR